jgi:thiamine biosynthesis lipoprotein
MEYHSFRAMNTDMLLAAEGSERSTRGAFEAARSFIEASESRLTRFSETSELSGLNRSAGRWFRASPELFDLVSMATSYHALTGGLFNPAILGALEGAGYDRSMDEIRARDVAPVLAGAPLVPEFAQLRLDEETREIWMPAGMRLDLGGLAKGWVAERAARILAQSSPACAVNAGGDMFLVGLPPGQGAWQVGLEDPRDPEQNLAVLNIGSGAVATSSITKRRWLQGGEERHHLIDPRTGKPAEAEWLSVTVIDAQATAAEVLAKAVLIAGPRGLDALAESCGPLAFIAVDRNGQLWGSERSREYIDVRSGIVAG